jgi:hypothetical protein
MQTRRDHQEAHFCARWVRIASSLKVGVRV